MVASTQTEAKQPSGNLVQIVIGYLRASNDATAARRINTIAEYCKRCFGGNINHPDFPDELTKHTNRQITDQNAGTALTIAAHRHDLPDDDREGDLPIHFIRDELVAGNIDHLVLFQAGDLGCNRIEDVVTRGVTVHLVKEGVILRPRRRRDELAEHVKHAVRVLCGEELDPSTLVTGIPHKGGRPPTGTTVENGQLRADTNYNKVRRTLQKVQRGSLSKSDAARRIDVSRKTIDNLLERTDLYQLD